MLHMVAVSRQGSLKCLCSMLGGGRGWSGVSADGAVLGLMLDAGCIRADGQGVARCRPGSLMCLPVEQGPGALPPLLQHAVSAHDHPVPTHPPAVSCPSQAYQIYGQAIFDSIGASRQCGCASLLCIQCSPELHVRWSKHTRVPPPHLQRATSRRGACVVPASSRWGPSSTQRRRAVSLVSISFFRGRAGTFTSVTLAC